MQAILQAAVISQVTVIGADKPPCKKRCEPRPVFCGTCSPVCCMAVKARGCSLPTVPQLPTFCDARRVFRPKKRIGSVMRIAPVSGMSRMAHQLLAPTSIHTLNMDVAAFDQIIEGREEFLFTGERIVVALDGGTDIAMVLLLAHEQ